MLAELNAAITNCGNAKEVAAAAREVLEEITLKQVGIACDGSYPLTDDYGRCVLYADSRLEVMVATWRPGDISSVHDHGYSTRGMVKVFQPMEHAIFQEDTAFRRIVRRTEDDDQILDVFYGMVHQLGNKIAGKRGVTLHVYFADHAEQFPTEGTTVFNVAQQVRFQTNRPAFYLHNADQVWNKVPISVGDRSMEILRDASELVRRRTLAGIPDNALFAACTNMVRDDRIAEQFSADELAIINDNLSPCIQ